MNRWIRKFWDVFLRSDLVLLLLCGSTAVGASIAFKLSAAIRTIVHNSLPPKNF